MAPKRKRVVPELVTVAPAPAPKRLAADAKASRPSEDLEHLATALRRLKPLKLVTTSEHLAALLPDARVLVFDSQKLLCEAQIGHLCKPQVRHLPLKFTLDKWSKWSTWPLKGALLAADPRWISGDRQLERRLLLSKGVPRVVLFRWPCDLGYATGRDDGLRVC